LPLSANAALDQVIAFTGRDTDKNVWVTIGGQLGWSFPKTRLHPRNSGPIY